MKTLPTATDLGTLENDVVSAAKDWYKGPSVDNEIRLRSSIRKLLTAERTLRAAHTRKTT